MTYEVFEIERHGSTATVWLNNPSRRNAMGPALWKELPLVMAEVDGDEAIRAVVVAARGTDFTVGLDLKTMMGSLAGAGAGKFRLLDQIYELQRSVTSVAKVTKPVIAAVHGNCIGGGIDLISACDIRYAAANTTFSIRETRMAIVADLGTLQRLPGIIGRGQLAELAFTGEDFGAERAAAMQLVNRVLPDGDATLAAARECAEKIAANSPVAVQGTKRVLDYCAGKSVEDGLRYVAAWNAAYLLTEDLQEAVQAFLEKRKPSFRGR